MSWHHLPFHVAAVSERQPCTPGCLLPDLPHLPAMKGDVSGEISALSRHSLSLGCPLSQRHSQGLCCQLPESAFEKEQGVSSQQLCSAPHTVPPCLGTPTGSCQGPELCSGTPSQWLSPGWDGSTGDSGGTASPHGPAPRANKPQNFALRW